jgi:hypothetical protein
MNEMRTLMEAIAKINEDELPIGIGSGSGNADVVYAYDEENRYTDSTGRKLQEIGQPGSLDSWYEVMNAALGWNDNEYNDFNADTVYRILKQFGNYEQYYYFAAREYSPSMYIGTHATSVLTRTSKLEEFKQFVEDQQRALKVSEIHIQDHTDFSNAPLLRLWWD